MPPLTFRPGATRHGASAATANVCIMQITSCPHKQAGANQCQSPLPSANQCRSLSSRSGSNGRGRRSLGGGQKKKNHTFTLSTSAIIYGRLGTGTRSLPEVKHGLYLGKTNKNTMDILTKKKKTSSSLLLHAFKNNPWCEQLLNEVGLEVQIQIKIL